MKLRFAITHESKGNRVLSLRNVAHNHFDTREQADTWLAATRAQKHAGLAKVLGPGMATVEVTQVDCYDHGEATGTVLG